MENYINLLLLYKCMTKAISVKIDEELWTAMKTHEEVNWSGVIRNTIKNKLEELEEKKFDKNKARKAIEKIKKIRQQGSFKLDKTGTEIIREWRDKRK